MSRTDANTHKNVSHRWVSDGASLVQCPACQATMELLKVDPPRSNTYIGRILFCPECKLIIPMG